MHFILRMFQWIIAFPTVCDLFGNTLGGKGNWMFATCTCMIQAYINMGWILYNVQCVDRMAGKNLHDLKAIITEWTSNLRQLKRHFHTSHSLIALITKWFPLYRIVTYSAVSQCMLRACAIKESPSWLCSNTFCSFFDKYYMVAAVSSP